MKTRLPMLCGVLLAIACGAAPLPAFPGAEGFGATTPGGRGGRTIVVSNLEDAGPGSFRAACEATGPRTIVFRVSGLIDLKSQLRIREPFVTIAGESAPGDGICLRGFACGVTTHDVIIRHLRFRPGDIAGKEQDAFWVSSSERVVIDHCSVSWGIDETLSVTKSRDVTVQWCFITESLNNSLHHKGEHGYGSLIYSADGGITFHHNLYAHHRSRNPRPGGLPDGPGLMLDFRNNVIYDWGSRAGYDGDTPVRMNYVGNYLKPGPSTRSGSRENAFLIGGDQTRIFARQNELVGFDAGNSDNTKLFRLTDKFAFPNGYSLADAFVPEHFAVPAVATDAARRAFDQVLNEAGATRPRRDAVDERIANNARTGSGRIINSQIEVGGWSEYSQVAPPPDADLDGLPDKWEAAHDLNSSSPDDARADRDSDGYTNLEEYLHERAGGR